MVTSKLDTVRFKAHNKAHIVLNKEICAQCTEKSCLSVCPAECYTLIDSEVEITYEGCLECGTCRIACERQAISWDYPLGGFGVSFRFS